MTHINPLGVCRDYIKGDKIARVRLHNRHFADTRLAGQLLGFKVEVDIHQGLEETIAWYMKR